MTPFTSGFSEELTKLGGLADVFKRIRPAIAPALATAAGGALIGSMASDPFRGMAVGGTLGLIPGVAWHYGKTNPVVIDHLKSIAASLPDVATGAGTGGAVGALMGSSKDRGHNAAIGATLGGISMGLPSYLKVRRGLAI